MRHRGKGQPVQRALELIERNYREIARRSPKQGVTVGLLECLDLVQETVLYIATDPHCNQITTDAEFIQYFEHRMKMIRFQETFDYKQELKQNADYQQTQKGQAEDWG